MICDDDDVVLIVVVVVAVVVVVFVVVIVVVASMCELLILRRSCHAELAGWDGLDGVVAKHCSVRFYLNYQGSESMEDISLVVEAPLGIRTSDEVIRISHIGVWPVLYPLTMVLLVSSLDDPSLLCPPFLQPVVSELPVL